MPITSMIITKEEWSNLRTGDLLALNPRSICGVVFLWQCHALCRKTPVESCDADHPEGTHFCAILSPDGQILYEFVRDHDWYLVSRVQG